MFFKPVLGKIARFRGASGRAAWFDGQKLTVVSVKKENGVFQLSGFFSGDASLYRKGYFGRGSVKTAELACGAPLFVKLVNLPPMPKAEAIATVKITERDSIPFSHENALIDVLFPRDDNSNPKSKALMAALPMSDFTGRKARLAKHGLTLTRVTAVPAAMEALARHGSVFKNSGAFLMVHAESQTLSVCAMAGGGMIFTRELVFKGDGREDYLEWAGEEIDRSLEAWERSGGAAMEKGWLVGSMALDKNAAKLSACAGIPFEIYDPLKDFIRAGDGCAAAVQTDLGPALAPLIGAAIGGAESISLTPRRNSLFYAPQSRFAKAAAACAAVVTIVLGSSFYSTHRDNGKDIETEINRLTAAKTEYEKLSAELRAVSASNAISELKLKKYASGEGQTVPDWKAIFAKVSRSMPHNSALTQFSVNMKGGHGGDSGGWIRNTRLEGLARGADQERMAALGIFMRNLSESPQFKGVTLTNAKMEKGQGFNGGVMSFEIAADIGKDAGMKTDTAGKAGSDG